jgi:multidrug efflux pump subunit AcrB
MAVRKLEKNHTLAIQFAGVSDVDALDDIAAEIHDAVVTDANAALGASVRADYASETVHVRFQTVAPSASARAMQLSHVYSTIETAIGGLLEESSDDLNRELDAQECVPA